VAAPGAKSTYETKHSEFSPYISNFSSATDTRVLEEEQGDSSALN